MEELNLDDLKQEATELGINYSANIGAAKLKSKIDDHYESQETSGKEIEDQVMANEKSEEKSAEKGKKEDAKFTARQLKRKAAEATRVVTIIDNDQRVNNQTTSCTVNCSNMYFDLGQVRLPLNMPVEVRAGHLNVLKELKIPQHAKDPQSGLSTVRMVPRYTISYEQ